MVKFFRKYFKEGITSILILSIFLLPFGSLSQVYAQTSGDYSTSGQGNAYPKGNNVTGGISGYISVLSPAISQLPLCAEKIEGSKIKGLFKGATSALKLSSVSTRGDSKINSEDFNIQNSIPTFDANANNTANEALSISKENKKSLQGLEENDTCLKSIGRLVTKMLLQKITVSTVEWINGGFEGKPLFLQDPGKYFGDIAKNEILQFKLEIDDPELYPFGRNFLRSQVVSLNRRFSDNARYSLDELITNTTPEYNATTFKASFSQGGWNAWDSLTQVPANNPLGFTILASTELSARLEGTSFSKGQEAQKTLDQSGGFLGDERCVEPEGITRAEHNAALVRGEKEMESYQVVIPGDNEGDIPTEITKERPTGKIVGVCEKWEYVTPGKLIAESATKVIGYPDNNLLRADDLNSAIASIMDALLNRWTADIANKGFANFGTEGSDGSFVFDGDNNTVGSISQTALDFPASALNTSWLKENPDFNIRTDLTQAMIDEQRIYQKKLSEENKVLNDLITTVYQLDYCIPGPHPGFEDDSERTLNAVNRTIKSYSASDFTNKTKEEIQGIMKTSAALGGAAIGASIGSSIPVVGTVIGAAIGALAGLLIDAFGGPSDEEKLDYYYAVLFGSFTGVHLSAPHTISAKITGKSDITGALEVMLDRYIKLIHKHYPRESLPSITPYASIEYNKIPGYRKTIDKNEYAVSALNGVIIRLSKLKDQLDEMNPDSTTYQDYLPMINEFSRLSASMATGNDIAKLVDDIKEDSDQIKYIYDDLLIGPYGCEKELQKDELELNIKLKQTLRQEYPFQIWYDYNKFSQNDELPTVPELAQYTNTQNKNTMPNYKIGPLGPGFLSSVMIPPINTCPQTGYDVLDCLHVYDLFNHVNDWPVLVGRNQGPDLNGENKQTNKDISFEQIIGVY